MAAIAEHPATVARVLLQATAVDMLRATEAAVVGMRRAVVVDMHRAAAGVVDTPAVAEEAVTPAAVGTAKV